MLTMVNDRGWLNGGLRKTKAGAWVVQINKPNPVEEGAKQTADDLPF